MATPTQATVPQGSRAAVVEGRGGRGLAWLALAVALAAVVGSLSLSLWMGLKACPLCFYQRAFALSLVGVLGMGLLTGVRSAGRLTLLALPLATAGLGVALFHVSLEARGKLECPTGLLGLGTSPQQSLTAFLVLFVLLVLDVVRAPKAGAGLWIGLVGAAALGALLAVGSGIANPPPPAPPTEPYAKPPDICRPPFHGVQRSP